jgi:hypothetical protein
MPNLDTVASEIMRNLSRGTGSDFEFLAQLFEDITILDTGSGNETHEAAYDHPGCQFRCHQRGHHTFRQNLQRMPWTGGFRQAFQDPHPSSRNQVGHFMTAVDMGYRPNQTLG